MNVVVLLAILFLGLLAEWLLCGEAVTKHRHRIEFDLKSLEDEHPRPKLRRVK